MQNYSRKLVLFGCILQRCWLRHVCEMWPNMKRWRVIRQLASMPHSATWNVFKITFTAKLLWHINLVQWRQWSEHDATSPYWGELVNNALISTTRAAAVRRARTQFGKRSFSVCGPDVWNSLPSPIRNIDSCPAFRRALKSHLFSCAFSS